MKTAGIHIQILKWIPRVLLLAIVGFSAYVYYMTTQNEKTDGPIKPPPPGNTTRTVRNLEYTHFDDGRMVYHVSADKTETLKNNQQKLENPEFIFYDENQEEAIRVTGKHCNISKDMNTITVFGDAVVSSPQRMLVKTHELKYDRDSEEFTTSNNATFDWKTLTGKSKGFVYHIPSETLYLQEKPEIHYINRGSANREPIVIEGDHGMIDRKNGLSYFEGDVVVTQGNDKIKAHRIEAAFRPGTNDLQKITGIKDVHIRFGRPGEPAEEKNDGKEDKEGKDKKDRRKDEVKPARYSPEETANQEPRMTNLFSTESGASKDLDAQLVELYFYDDGRTIKSFDSSGDCTFVLHNYSADGKPKEDRIIKGDKFQATFNAAGDMEEFRAMQNVSVRVQPQGNAKNKDIIQKQTIFCDDLTSTILPNGEVKEINFNNNFRHVQDTRTVTSEKAVYHGTGRKTDLIGSPEIKDASFSITSNSMELFEETSGIKARGNVKSSFVQNKDSKNPSTFPFSSPSNQPVYINAESMDWDGQKSEATYTDKAKLWQDKNVITAAKLVINDKDKTMSAYDKVHTIFYNNKKTDSKTAPAPNEEKPKEPVKTEAKAEETKEEDAKMFGGEEKADDGPITVDAGIMNYAEKDRIIHFEKEVKILTSSTKINSDKADFYLKQKSSELDRLYGQGKVSIVHEEKKGNGSQVTFFAEDKKLILEGNPKLTEPGKADIVGDVLTLFLADDRILIDGEEDGRAITTLQMKGTSLTTSSKSKSSKSKSNSKSKSKEDRDRDAGSKDRKPH